MAQNVVVVITWGGYLCEAVVELPDLSQGSLKVINF